MDRGCRNRGNRIWCIVHTFAEHFCESNSHSDYFRSPTDPMNSYSHKRHSEFVTATCAETPLVVLGMDNLEEPVQVQEDPLSAEWLTENKGNIFSLISLKPSKPSHLPHDTGHAFLVWVIGRTGERKGLGYEKKREYMR